MSVGEMRMTGVHRIAGLKISRVAPSPDRVTSRDLLPDLEPPEERLRKSRTTIFSADSIELSQNSAVEDLLEPDLREEHNDLTARITVYVMNLTIMMFTLPLGLALLAFNIIGGENLRTTAHIMALTGMFMAISNAQTGLNYFW